MTTETARKTAKVRLNSIMLRDSTLDHLTGLADSLGKNSPAGLAADILETMSDMKAENFHIALAEFIKIGRK